MRATTGIMVGSVVGLFAAGTLFVLWPAGPAPDAPAALDLAAAQSAGDGGLTGNKAAAVSQKEQFGWADGPQQPAPPSPAPKVMQAPTDVAEAVPLDTPEPAAMAEVQPRQEPPPVLPSEEPIEEQVVPTVPPVAATPMEPAPEAALDSPVPPPASAAPAGDPMVEAFARVALITFDLADAYAPAIEAAKASGTDKALRDELARETRIAIEEEFAWGFDAYVTFAQEVRRNPALETDVARAMARLRP